MISSEEIEVTKGDGVHPDQGSAESRPVLLAEDDPALRRYLEVMLQRAGYEVASAADGLEAMNILMSLGVQAVITDAMMPNLSGYELCRFIRSSEHLAHLPIILLSALDPKNASAETERIDAFLSKPVSAEDLLECLATLTLQAR
jgi:CheY-like chemotaxis protein